MPEEKPAGLLTNTPVMTGRTIEVVSKQESMQSPMMSPSTRKDQIKSQALQTLRGIAGSNLSKFGPGVAGSPEKKIINVMKAGDKEEEAKVEPKLDPKVAKATAQLKKMGI